MLNKLKTATVTWISYNNFGSYLQAYALQKVLLALGVENSIIDDARIVEGHKASVYEKLYVKIYRIVCIALRKHKEQLIALNRFLKFKERLLIVDNTWNTFSDLNIKYDFFIAGSDQIWYPDSQVFNPYYYLDFTDKVKISYAASIGTSRYPDSYKQKVSDLLRNYKAISIREKIGVGLLQTFISNNIENVLDPTLLLDRTDWDKVASKIIVCSKKYAICYLLTYNEAYLDFIRKDCTLKGMNLVIMSDFDIYRKYADIVLPAGPCEFISAIKSADFIYTDSYHCTIFSIIYQKNFLTFKRFSDNSGRNQNSRLVDLFNLTGIRRRFISEENLLLPLELEVIDYQKVNENIDKARKHSVNYLINSLTL